MAHATVPLSAAAASAGIDTPAAPGTPQAAEAEAPLDGFLLLRDRVRGLFAFNRTSLAGHAIGAIIIEMIFAGVAPRPLRIVWGVGFATVWLLRAWLAVRFAQREPTSSAGLERRLRAWQAGVLASGALWGIAAWFFSAFGSAPHQVALVLVVYTFCVASVPILGPQYRLFVLFVLMVFAPAIARVVVDGSTLGWQLGAVMTVAMGMTMLLGRNYRDSFERVVGLKLRN